MNTITYQFPVGTPYSAKIKWISAIKNVDQTIDIKLTAAQHHAVVTVSFELEGKEQEELKPIWDRVLADIRKYHGI